MLPPHRITGKKGVLQLACWWTTAQFALNPRFANCFPLISRFPHHDDVNNLCSVPVHILNLCTPRAPRKTINGGRRHEGRFWKTDSPATQVPGIIRSDHARSEKTQSFQAKR